MRTAAVQQRALAIELRSAEAEAVRLLVERPSAARYHLAQAQADADAARADAAVTRAAELEEEARRSDAQLAVATRKLVDALAQLRAERARHAAALGAVLEPEAEGAAAGARRSDRDQQQRPEPVAQSGGSG